MVREDIVQFAKLHKLIKYADPEYSWKELFINPKIQNEVSTLDIKSKKLGIQKQKQIEIRDKKRHKLEQELQEKIQPHDQKIRDLNNKMSEIYDRKKMLIEGSCPHKTHSRWSGGDYNERLIKECLLCDKDFGEL